VFARSRPWVGGRAVGRTLEVACGTGANFAHYPPGVSVTATDFSASMVDAARVTARRLGLDVAVERADAAALPFADGFFDTAVATFALCCVPDERAVLAEMVRVLRPDGPSQPWKT